MTSGLTMAAKLMEAMVAHCLEEQPCEACGLLTGPPGCVRHGYAAANLIRSRGAYRLDPNHHARILAEATEREEELVAIYHSHPTGHPFLSPVDLRQAVHYPEALRIIVALRGPVEVRAFRVQEGRAEEVPILIREELTGEWHDLRGPVRPPSQA